MPNVLLNLPRAAFTQLYVRALFLLRTGNKSDNHTCGSFSSLQRSIFALRKAVAAPPRHPQRTPAPHIPCANRPGLPPAADSFWMARARIAPHPQASGCWAPTQGSKGVPQVLLVDEAIPVLVHDGESLAETRALSGHPPTYPSPGPLPREIPPPCKGLSSRPLLPGQPQYRPSGHPVTQLSMSPA